jgi:hypothetical protein
VIEDKDLQSSRANVHSSPFRGLLRQNPSSHTATDASKFNIFDLTVSGIFFGLPVQVALAFTYYSPLLVFMFLTH